MKTRSRCGRGPSRTGVKRFRTRRHASESVHQLSSGATGQLAIGTARLVACPRRRRIGRTGRIAALMSPGNGLRPSPPPLLRSAIRPIRPIQHQGLSPACAPASIQLLHRASRDPRRVRPERHLPATSSHPSGQKTAAPMTGLKVQQTYAEGRSRKRILQSCRSAICRAGWDQKPAERLLPNVAS